MRQKILDFFKKTKRRRVSEMYSSLELVQTPVQNLMLGMYVSELDIPWLESPFLFQGFFIETEQDLQILRETCQYVYVDASKQKKRKAHTKLDSKRLDSTPSVFGKPQERLGSFESEIGKAENNYKETGVIVSSFMDKIATGEGIDTKLAKEAVSACVNSVLHSPDAFLWLTQLKHKDEYTAQHSLNVCVLSIVLGRQVGLTEQKLNQVGLCGMMHDMGKMLIPLEVLNKPGRLDEGELAIMQSHTTLGYELLTSSENMFYGAVETALTHHEHMNGKGYPRKINATGLSFYSNIVAIADMYDAITSDRVYKKGKTHHEATKTMLDVSGSHLDSRLVVKFIESLGAYPPGSFVELSNGCIALVVEENSRFKLWPKVLLILDKDKNSLEEIILDLSKVLPDSDDSEAMISIRAIINPEDYQISREKYYHQGVVHKGFARQ
jgi:HD-GYP domain-containing protein (c-di-GMP phosphodiesterase class II)